MTVVCVGIAVQDIVFRVDEHPTRPGKYRAEARHVVGGGVAANAAVTVAVLGGEARLLSCVGDDQVGDEIVAELSGYGVGVSGIRRVEGASSPLSMVLVDASGERLVVNHASAHLFEPEARTPEGELRDARAVLADMRWPAAAIAALEAGAAAGVPAIVDCDHDPNDNRGEEILAAATHVVFSLPTLAAWSGAEDPGQALRFARQRTSAWSAATDGADGVYWLEGASLHHGHSFPVDVVDTLGAGDVFHGAFALGLTQGMSNPAALHFASAAAAIKCTRPDGRAGIPTRSEVDALLAAAGPTEEWGRCISP